MVCHVDSVPRGLRHGLPRAPGLASAPPDYARGTPGDRCDACLTIDTTGDTADADPQPRHHRPRHHLGAHSLHRLRGGAGIQGRRVEGGLLHRRVDPVAGHRGRRHPGRHREQTTEAEHRPVDGAARREDRHRRRAAVHRPAPSTHDGPAQEAEGSAEVADRRGQHVQVVRPGPRAAGPALGTIAAGVAVIVDAKLSSVGSTIALILFCLLSTVTYLAAEIYAWLRPEATQALLDPAYGPGSPPTPTRPSSSSPGCSAPGSSPTASTSWSPDRLPARRVSPVTARGGAGGGGGSSAGVPPSITCSVHAVPDQ